MRISLQDHEFIPVPRHDQFQQHELAVFRQYVFRADLQVLEDAVGQAVKGEDVDIEQRMVRMQVDQGLLGHQAGLFRDQQDILPIRMCDRLPDDSFIDLFGFSGDAAPCNKCKTHGGSFKYSCHYFNVRARDCKEKTS